MIFNDGIAEKDFFGRRDVLSLLDKRVSALKDGYRQNIAITGQCLAGKTCLLHCFLDKVKDPSILPIYVEVIDEPFPSFAERFIGTLLYTFLKIKNEEVRENIDYLLEKSQKYIPQTVKAILEIKDRLNKKEFERVYLDILNLSSIVKTEAKIRCIVIFDEFQNLSLFSIKDPFLHFGKVIMIQKDTMYIISSSDKSAIQKILAEKLALLFGNFEIIELRGFDFNSSKEFLNKKLINFELGEELKTFLTTFTDGNPFYTDLLCTKMRDLALTLPVNTIDAKIIVDAIENLYFNSKGTVNQYFTNLINNLYLSVTTLNILITIAGGSHTLIGIKEKLKIGSAEISSQLKKLIELNIILKNGTFYFFIDRSFLFWIREVYSRKRSSLISSANIRSEQFKQDIHIYISKFIFSLKNDCCHQISELFTKFKGEIVEVGGRRHRLPEFKKIDVINLGERASLLLAHKNKKLWSCFIKAGKVDEDNVLSFTKEIKKLKAEIINKILIPLDGMDINATLLAKENKMWIWGLEDLNFVMDIYNQERIIRYT